MASTASEIIARITRVSFMACVRAIRVPNEKMKKSKHSEATFAGGPSTCSTDRQLSLLHLATAGRERVPTSGDCVFQADRLKRMQRRVRLDSVRERIIALVALVLSLHAGFSCGFVQAVAPL